MQYYVKRIIWLSFSINFLKLIGLLLDILFIPLCCETFVFATIRHILTGTDISASYNCLYSHL